MNVELESKLVIPEEIATTFIRNFTQDNFLENFNLSEKTTQSIFDIYYDFEDSILNLLDSGLRIRCINGLSVLVTFKGPRLLNHNSIHEREEFEESLSSETLNLLMIKLSKVIGRKISYTPNKVELTLRGASEVFSKLGLIEQFRLYNNRISRKVYKQKEEIAEISFDSVAYQLRHHISNFYEIEIEATDVKLKKDILDIENQLKNTYSEITSSTKSKYSRGLDLQLTKEFHRVETKLIIKSRKEAIHILKKLKEQKVIAENFKIGTHSQYEIIDDYFDFNNFPLHAQNAYIRHRKVMGKSNEITFRDFNLNENDRIINSKQIKGLANYFKISEIVEYLVSQKIIKNDQLLPLKDDINFTSLLKKNGFKKLIGCKINRYVFPLMKNSICFASVKFDFITFKSDNKERVYFEIELSTEEETEYSKSRLRLIALHLAEKFNLLLTDKPKPNVGIALIQGIGIEQIAQEKLIPIIHARVNISYAHLLEFKMKNDKEKIKLHQDLTLAYSNLVEQISQKLDINLGENCTKTEINSNIVRKINELLALNNCSLKKHKEKWLQMIGRNKILVVFEEILMYLSNNDLLTQANELVLLQQRYTSILSDKNKGISQEKDNDFNKIIWSLIDFISNL